LPNEASGPVDSLVGGPTAAGVPGRACEVGELLGTIAALREHCPWMGALTHESLVEYLLEEAFEVAETIETGAGEAELQGELGDVLLQVVLHSRLAEERGTFDFDDVVQGLAAKMIRRNPHVFRPDGSLQDTFPATVDEIVRKWDSVKLAEKPARADPFEGIPKDLAALARAQKSLDRAERAGRAQKSLDRAERADWAQGTGVPAPGEPQAGAAPPSGTGRRSTGPADAPATEEELGDLLFDLVASARTRGFDAERALRGAVRRYQDTHQDFHTDARQAPS
jgi:uncharacterized protein YabN with tetrapyrrole methylase and pyrophosphatase domain